MTERSNFHIFGDESHFSGAVVYALVIVKQKSQPMLEAEIQKVKKSFGLDPLTVIHCREIFNKHAKAKSALKGKSKNEVCELLSRVLATCTGTGASFWIGHVDGSKVPDGLIFQVDGASDNHSNVLKLTDVKMKIQCAYNAAMGPVLHILGNGFCKAWLDGDTTKIEHFGKCRQANSLKPFFPIGHNDKRFVPTIVTGEKPALIEVADILAYAAAHHLSKTYTNDKPSFSAMLNGQIGYSEAVFEGPEFENSEAMFPVRVPDIHISNLKAFAQS